MLLRAPVLGRCMHATMLCARVRTCVYIRARRAAGSANGARRRLGSIPISGAGRPAPSPGPRNAQATCGRRAVATSFPVAKHENEFGLSASRRRCPCRAPCSAGLHNTRARTIKAARTAQRHYCSVTSVRTDRDSSQRRPGEERLTYLGEREMASRYKAGPRLVRPGAGAGLAGLRPPSGGAIAKPVAKPVPQAGAAVPQRRAVKPTGPRAAPQQLEPEPAVQTSQEIKVGDRVLVGGVKPGVVAYLGSTQFAPRGIWAGIILDSSDGKNNGVVQGVAYFECEQNRGLFSRLEKLMLIPHESGPRSTATGPLQKNTRTPAAPSDASLVEFSVGDRILVDGSKPGTVAFLGTTEFARGEWAGVILDAPEGKNSGTVGGTQYFKCEPNHGLFSRPNRLLMAKKAQASPPRERHGIRSRSPQPGLANDPETQRQAAIQHSMQSTPVNPEQLQTLREKLKLGDRVLVGGQKEGFLRYMGPTEFAKGVWVGVELEDSLGKNDGAVSGKR